MRRSTVTLVTRISAALLGVAALIAAAFWTNGTARAADPGEAWQLLAKVDVREVTDGDTWRAEKKYPRALQSAADTFQISGYFVPIEAQAWIQSFVLVETPLDCPFCGGGGYGPVLEVQLKRPLRDMPEFSQITVRGTLDFITDPETFQAFRLVDAVPVN
ncbi:MAG: hypothetical protein AAFR35_04875 [Pseudomonadota bacterium]